MGAGQGGHVRSRYSVHTHLRQIGSCATNRGCGDGTSEWWRAHSFAPSVSRLACYGPITLVASSIGEVRRGRLRISPQVACLHRVALVRPRRWRLSRPVAATTPRFGRPTRRGVGDEAPRQCAPARENGGWALDFGSRPDAAIYFSIRCSTRSTTSPRKTSPTIADPGLPNLLTGELSWRIRRCPRGSRA